MYSCFQPKRLKNKFTGKVMYVPCRECDFCRQSRSSELSKRIDREFLNPANGSCYFVTLDYRPEDLPVYEKYEDGYWHTNRDLFQSRFDAIPDEKVEEYYIPTNAVNPESFGHLCYPDILKWITAMRSAIHHRLGKRRTHKEDLIFGSYGKEDLQFRYFICGEYGPTTFRPHYHALLWFKHPWTDEQEEYISEIIHKSWPFGSVDIQACHDNGVRNYVSSYVTSSTGLPKVLQRKSVRPFVIFSKNPIIGAYNVDYKEIQEILDTGAVNRVKWDDKEKTFVDDVVSSSFFRRHFPKCQGFAYEDYHYKLRIYSYVFNYFKDLGITHTADDVEDLRLCDIVFPKREIRDPQGRIVYGQFEEWAYADKYASLVAYRYCVVFGCSPEYILDATTRLYSRMELAALGRFYEYQNDVAEKQSKTCGLQFTINHDLDFLASLPVFLSDLALWQYNALESYGIDVLRLYDSEFETLDRNVTMELDYHNDPEYTTHVDDTSSFVQRGVKNKKANEYKCRLRVLRVDNVNKVTTINSF